MNDVLVEINGGLQLHLKSGRIIACSMITVGIACDVIMDHCTEPLKVEFDLKTIEGSEVFFELIERDTL